MTLERKPFRKDTNVFCRREHYEGTAQTNGQTTSIVSIGCLRNHDSPVAMEQLDYLNLGEEKIDVFSVNHRDRNAVIIKNKFYYS